MYSWEINDYILKKNNILSRDEYLKITDININTQICNISYNVFEDMFYIATNDGYIWKIQIKNP